MLYNQNKYLKKLTIELFKTIKIYCPLDFRILYSVFCYLTNVFIFCIIYHRYFPLFNLLYFDILLFGMLTKIQQCIQSYFIFQVISIFCRQNILDQYGFLIPTLFINFNKIISYSIFSFVSVIRNFNLNSTIDECAVFDITRTVTDKSGGFF